MTIMLARLWSGRTYPLGYGRTEQHVDSALVGWNNIPTRLRSDGTMSTQLQSDGTIYLLDSNWMEQFQLDYDRAEQHVDSTLIRQNNMPTRFRSGERCQLDNGQVEQHADLAMVRQTY